MSYDKPFLLLSVLLTLAGTFIFISASFGLLLRSGPSFASILISQIGIGLAGGIIIAYVLYRTPLAWIQKVAPFAFIFSCLLLILVFVPDIGLSHGGARRWLLIGSFSFQPAELLKITYLLILAAWCSMVGGRIKTVRFGVLPFLCINIIVGILLILQPDTGTFIIVGVTGLAMFIIAGAQWKHILVIIGIGILAILLLVMWKPYIKDRVLTFINPDRDPYGSSYQIQQSLVAIGSGGFSGRGFGQSIQKFNYLPEPIGDSIFAVLGEEFGFIGTVSTVLLLVLFALRGLGIAMRSKNDFGRLVVVGIVILIITQSFMNIAAVLGLIPLTGEPLVFVSHGGSSLLFALANIGLVLNISAHPDRSSA